MSDNIPSPASGAEMVLQDVGRRYVQGSQLSMADENMAMVASAAKNAERFGPTIKDFEISRPQLPENVKGTLVEHSS